MPAAAQPRREPAECHLAHVRFPTMQRPRETPAPISGELPIGRSTGAKQYCTTGGRFVSTGEGNDDRLRNHNVGDTRSTGGRVRHPGCRNDRAILARAYAARRPRSSGCGDDNRPGTAGAHLAGPLAPAPPPKKFAAQEKEQLEPQGSIVDLTKVLRSTRAMLDLIGCAARLQRGDA
jgi:hypothetical protein